MVRQHLVFVLVAALLVAGCVGGSGPEAEDGSTTQPPAAANGGDGGGGSDGGGSDAADSDDGDASGTDGVYVAENQTAVLAAAGSYAWHWEMRGTEGGEVTSLTGYGGAMDVDEERKHFRSIDSVDPDAESAYETYTEGDTVYSKDGVGDAARYAVGEQPFHAGMPMMVQSYVGDADDLDGFEADGTETVDDVAVTRYVSTERPSWVAQRAQSGEELTWTEFRFVVEIDEDGLVRTQRWESEGVDADDVTHVISFSYAIEDVGSAVVEEPAWVETAREQVGDQ